MARAPMCFFLGRCWYESNSREICASRRCSSSAFADSSRKALAESVRVDSLESRSVANLLRALNCFMSSRVCRSRLSTCSRAAESCVFCESTAARGSGELSRRLASVLPPPSRLACARKSACDGLVAVLALTNDTSNGGEMVACLSSFGSSKCSDSRIA